MKSFTHNQKVAAAVVGAAAVIAGACYLLRKSPKKDEGSAPSMSQKEMRSPAPMETVSKSSNLMDFDEDSFALDLRQSIMHIANERNTTTAREKKIFEVLRAIDTDSLKPPTVFLIAQWMHVLYTARTASTKDSRSGEERLKILQENRNCIETAWSLLSMKPEQISELDEDQVHMLDALLLDVACRLKDTEKMNQSLDRILMPAGGKDFKDLQLEELVSAFCTAPLLGRWDNMVMLGDALSQKQAHVLEMFHAGSMKDQNMLDYAVLYRLSKEQAMNPHGEPAFEWMTYEVTDFRIRFRDAQSDDSAHLEELRSQLPTDLWQPVQTYKGLHLLRLGAVVHWVNPGALPLALSGLAFKDHYILAGYLEMAEDTGKVRHSETFDLRPDPKREGYWIGTDTIKQEKVEGNVPGIAEHTIIFDIELKITKDETGVWKVL
eukprot:TRINITY_DN19570_c0_g1::TRINITY_DN19570_c0_g1_i1::g.24611::m.24611 TRINITY_DN19570_c0_g1::TRINITY_DN19570_c0_g1_i1::g.24611  ORF type:complete len:446 (-),score=125.82 TRINITY_DN19570_c0_g1_i1:320-1624(-)